MSALTFRKVDDDLFREQDDWPPTIDVDGQLLHTIAEGVPYCSLKGHATPNGFGYTWIWAEIGFHCANGDATYRLEQRPDSLDFQEDRWHGTRIA